MHFCLSVDRSVYLSNLSIWLCVCVALSFSNSGWDWKESRLMCVYVCACDFIFCEMKEKINKTIVHNGHLELKALWTGSCERWALSTRKRNGINSDGIFNNNLNYNIILCPLPIHSFFYSQWNSNVFNVLFGCSYRRFHYFIIQH